MSDASESDVIVTLRMRVNGLWHRSAIGDLYGCDHPTLLDALKWLAEEEGSPAFFVANAEDGSLEVVAAEWAEEET